MAIQSCPKRRATLALLTAVAVAVVVVVSSSVFVVVVGAEDNNDDPPPPPNQNKKKRKKVRAKFVNQLPDTAIEVYWENPSDHTHKFEANIRPRGGWHVSDTFVGHGERGGECVCGKNDVIAPVFDSLAASFFLILNK